MELALITAQQVAVLFLLIGTGMVAVKTGVLKLENKQALSNLLVYIIVPAMAPSCLICSAKRRTM